jgi:hypothetical protein
LQGLKPNIDLIGFIGPTEVVPLLQSLCSGHAGEFFRKLWGPGAHFAALVARLKPCPFKATAFSAGRKAYVHFVAVSARLKSCHFKTAT